MLSCIQVPVDGVSTDNWIYQVLTPITTNNYGNLTELHTPKITVSTAHIKSSQSSLAVAWAFQQWAFTLAWLPKLSPASATRFSHLTAATLN